MYYRAPEPQESFQRALLGQVGGKLREHRLERWLRSLRGFPACLFRISCHDASLFGEYSVQWRGVVSFVNDFKDV